MSWGVLAGTRLKRNREPYRPVSQQLGTLVHSENIPIPVAVLSPRSVWVGRGGLRDWELHSTCWASLRCRGCWLGF